ncbi:MAG: recombinase family protein [Beijerinckiaceae bacterium]
MPSAIAYIRISANGMSENPEGLDAQTRKIREFAKSRGYRLEEFYDEIASGRGTVNRLTHPALVAAWDHSKTAEHLHPKKRPLPVFVASFDRIHHNPAIVAELRNVRKLVIVSAKVGEHDDFMLAPGEAARVRGEREKISEGTKAALAKVKSSGKALGNTTNLEVAGRKGAKSNHERAKLRLREFEIVLAEAKRLGARTAKEVAAKFKDIGHLTAGGHAWTAENVSGYLRKVKTAKAHETAASKPVPSAPPTPPPIADANRVLTPDGVARVEKAKIARGFKPRASGKFMVELGYSRYDTSMDLSGTIPIEEGRLRALEKWLPEVEATY